MADKQFSRLALEFDRLCRKHNISGKFLFAVSGGADSIFLLQLFIYGKKKGLFTFVEEAAVIHFNHMLRGKASNRDEEFVEKICRENSLKFSSVKFSWSKKASQEEARKKRESWYKINQKDHWLLLGHQLTDQGETLLFRLTRGTGIHGLSCMPIVDWERNRFRPLLGLELDALQIRKIAKDNKILFREDKSNQSDKYARNRIRLRVLPLLQKENPRVLRRLNQLTLAAQEISITNLSPVFSTKGMQCHRIGNAISPASLAKTFSLNSAQTRQLQNILNSGSGMMILNKKKKIVYGQKILMYLDQDFCLKNELVDNELRTLLGNFKWKKSQLIKLVSRPSKPPKKLFQEAGVPEFFRSCFPIVALSNGNKVLIPHTFSANCKIVESDLEIDFFPNKLARAIFQTN